MYRLAGHVYIHKRPTAGFLGKEVRVDAIKTRAESAYEYGCSA